MKPLTYINLETTNYCNLDCSFCDRSNVIHRLEHMSVERFIHIMEKLKHHPLERAKLMGLGEPYLNPKFDELCRIFKEYFPKTTLIVATNCQYPIKEGTKMRARMQETMKYIDLLYLSIDGYEESYERDRSPAKWSKLLEFLDNFKNIDRHKCKVTCNYVVNPDNINDIQTLYDNLIVPNNIEELRLNIAQEWAEDKTMVGGYTKEQLTYLKENWSENIKGIPYWDYDQCIWVRESSYITVDGGVEMCCMNTSVKKFGNILDDDIDNIRQSKRFQAIKKGCDTNNPTSHCVNCSYKELNKTLNYLIGDEKTP